MTYDPTRDEPIYTASELEFAIQHAFQAGRDLTLDFLGSVPLTQHGRWEPGRVYAVSSIVFKDGRRWVSTVQTASEPSPENAAWRAVNLLRDSDPTPPTAA